MVKVKELFSWTYVPNVPPQDTGLYLIEILRPLTTQNALIVLASRNLYQKVVKMVYLLKLLGFGKIIFLFFDV